MKKVKINSNLLKRMQLFMLVVLCAVNYGSAQLCNFEWAKSSDRIWKESIVDHLGNLIIISDDSVHKFNSLGNKIWSAGIGGHSVATGQCLPNSLAVDKIGNIYIVGYFNGTVDFDPSSTNFELSTIGGYNTYLYKLIEAGKFLWAKSFSGSDKNYPNHIIIDQNDHLYISGTFNGTVDFDPNVGTYDLTSHGLIFSDVFLTKLDTAGNLVWAKNFGSDKETDGPVSTVLSSGSVFFAASFKSSMDLDPGIGEFNVSPIGGSVDVFIVKLDGSGNFISGGVIGGDGIETSRSIINDSKDNVYITGSFGTSFTAPIDMDPGVGIESISTEESNYSFLLKLDSSGNYIWANNVSGTRVKVDVDDAVYTNGTVNITKSIDIDPGTRILPFSSSGMQDVFIRKLDRNGDFVWVARFDGNKDDFGYSLNVDKDLNIFVLLDSYSDSVDVDPKFALSTNIKDKFIAVKLSQEMKPGSIANFNSNGGFIKVYPNPSGNNIFFNANSGGVVKILNLMGQQVTRATTTAGTNCLDISMLPLGMYNLCLIDELGNLNYCKFIKQ
jgi:hypothetical protein